jgi:methionine aminotransferase
MSINIDSKLPHVGTTIFTVIGELANRHNAINLGQGFPDFSAPPALLDRVDYHIQHGHNQYAPMAGVASLREAIAAKVGQSYGRPISPDNEVTVTPGATAALYCAITACVRPGDEVIVFDPAYDSYEPAIELSGGRAVHLPLLPPEFAIDWQRVEDAINPRTRMIILNSPHNPTGATLSAADLETLAELVRETDILLLSDEVYEHLVYDGETHHSLLSHEELAARAFVVFSFGKTYHVTGWKTGYCIAPPALTAELRKVHQYVAFVAVTPIQLALADYLRDCPEHYRQLPAFYQRKRDLFCEHMTGSRFKFTPARGTFFQLMDYSDISDRDDMAMAQWLTRETGVAAIPVSVFYQEPPAARYVRFCFAKEDQTLIKAAELLCRI